MGDSQNIWILTAIFTILVVASFANILYEMSLEDKYDRCYGVFPLIPHFAQPQKFSSIITFWFLVSTFFGAYIVSRAVGEIIWRSNRFKTIGAVLVLAGFATNLGLLLGEKGMYVIGMLLGSIGFIIIKNEDSKARTNKAGAATDIIIVLLYVFLMFYYFMMLTSVY